LRGKIQKFKNTDLEKPRKKTSTTKKKPAVLNNKQTNKKNMFHPVSENNFTLLVCPGAPKKKHTTFRAGPLKLFTLESSHSVIQDVTECYYYSATPTMALLDQSGDIMSTINVQQFLENVALGYVDKRDNEVEKRIDTAARQINMSHQVISPYFIKNMCDNDSVPVYRCDYCHHYEKHPCKMVMYDTKTLDLMSAHLFDVVASPSYTTYACDRCYNTLAIIYNIKIYLSKIIHLKLEGEDAQDYCQRVGMLLDCLKIKE
jgi:hypothetical protein